MYLGAQLQPINPGLEPSGYALNQVTETLRQCVLCDHNMWPSAKAAPYYYSSTPEL